MTKLIMLIGLELIGFGSLLFLTSRCNFKLNSYLAKNYLPFYKTHIDLPFLAGDVQVIKKHLHSIKSTYLGSMPDNVSAKYQTRMKIYAFLSILSFLIFLFTFLVVIMLK